MSLTVALAGHNLDRDLLLEIRGVLEDLEAGGTAERMEAVRERIRRLLAADNWTPETISAAYARVSRDPRSVTELRAIARQEVDKARRSNENIIFGLGHSSVAEHAVFNFDILGLSRLAVEVLERQRLASYTEKSQRYILLEEDWVLPQEIRGGPCEAPYREAVAAQQRLYREAYDELMRRLRALHPEAAGDRKRDRLLEGMAKEDARYALGLCTTVQLGETINARNLEGLLARCRAHPLCELRDLGEKLRVAVAGLAPSLIKYIEPTPYLSGARPALARATAELVRGGGAGAEAARIASDPAPAASVQLVRTTPDPDGVLVSSLLWAGGAGSTGECARLAARLDSEAKRSLVMSHLRTLGPHDSVLREYEHVDLAFELVVSAACFAQLKRHRMATLSPLPYDPALGITVPESFADAGLTASLRALAEQAAECHRTIAAHSPEAATYVLTNAHRRRVLFKINARELHHLARLREDSHAQWDIRQVAARMIALAREKMPLTLLLASAKDRFEENRKGIFPGD